MQIALGSLCHSLSIEQLWIPVQYDLPLLFIVLAPPWSTLVTGHRPQTAHRSRTVCLERRYGFRFGAPFPSKQIRVLYERSKSSQSNKNGEGMDRVGMRLVEQGRKKSRLSLGWLEMKQRGRAKLQERAEQK